MFTRKVVTAAASALALVALSVPVVNAQDGDTLPDEAASGSISLGSLEGGDPDASSLAGGSEGSSDDISGEDGAGGENADSGSLGGGSLDSLESASLESASLDSASGDDTSVGDPVPETDAVCELPALGGSVAKFYPLLGIDGVPTGVIDLITSALDSFPNLLDVVAGEGRGSALVGEAGSLSEGLCTLVFGGEMVPPPVTVIVDDDGNPVTTVTGTATTSPGTSSPATTTAAASGAAGTDGVDLAGADSDGVAADDADAGEAALATSVPVPGA
ncbi:hypothetical protein [Dietzia kunjamensis]|uniref:hypothetical protein n=1 Tax=Dietzia kunjamensis TaxID=322509 RepID=UPI0039BD8685